MTAYVVDVRPGALFAVVVSAQLGGVTVAFALRWLPRLGRWSCQMRTTSGEVLSIDAIVQPAGRVLFDARDPRVPPGSLVWTGPDDYTRTDLGETLRLIYVE